MMSALQWLHTSKAWLAALLLVCSPVWAAPRTIILTNGEWPPFMSARLPGGGSLSRVISEAFRLEGYQVEYRYVPWNRAYEEPKTGRYAGSIGWAPNEERLKWYQFSDPAVTVEMVFFHLKEHSFPWKTLADLSPYLIGVTRADFYSDEFAALTKAGKLHPDPSDEEMDNFRKLLAGRIDLFPIERSVGLYLLNLNFSGAEQEQIAYDSQSFWQAPLHLIISRKRPDAPALLAAFNRGLKKLKASGDYQRILDAGLKARPTSAP